MRKGEKKKKKKPEERKKKRKKKGEGKRKKQRERERESERERERKGKRNLHCCRILTRVRFTPLLISGIQVFIAGGSGHCVSPGRPLETFNSLLVVLETPR
jgi:hypothetical protein